MNVFFDLDGTLADTRADLAKAVNMTRRDCGLAEIPQERVVECVGDGVRNLLARAIPERAGDVEALVPVQARNYSTCRLDATTLYPGVRETLQELSRRGWNLAVVTNKPEADSAAILEGLGIARYFKALVAGGTTPHLKPSPETIRAAAGAGIRAAYCTWGYGSARDERYYISISSMRELLRHCPDREEY